MHGYDTAFPALRDVYLEDSWVLALYPSEFEVTFRIEAVLTASHPGYHPPKPGEQHCYAAADLRVRGDLPIDYHLSGARPAVDLTGTQDLGNIDTFLPMDHRRRARCTFRGGRPRWRCAT